MEKRENKVFVLPCNEKDDIVGRASVISLASVLRSLRIPVGPDRVIHDPKYRNSQAVASFLQLQHSVKVALWIITGRFALEGDMAKKMMEWYELSSSDHHTETIIVFLDCGAEISRCIPQFLQDVGSVYFISSNCLSIHENRAFANLHTTLHRMLQEQAVLRICHQYHMINPHCELLSIQCVYPIVMILLHICPIQVPHQPVMVV